MHSAFLAAPFVKVAVVERLFSGLPVDAPVTLVTRWRAEEVASGVSDLEVWDRVRERPDSRMFLESSLHAKYYRFDDRAFVGSANLTGAGLGWRTPANIELLEAFQTLPEFERELLRRSTPPTDSLRRAISEAAELLRSELGHQVVEVSTEGTEPQPDSTWLPRTRHPEDLYLAYGGQAEELARATRESTRADLAALELPPSLSRGSFESLVGTRLLSVQVVARLDAYLAEVRRFGEVRDWLAEELALTRDEATTAWQTLMRWLVHFQPSRYERTRPRHSEGLRRVAD